MPARRGAGVYGQHFQNKRVEEGEMCCRRTGEAAIKKESDAPAGGGRWRGWRIPERSFE